MTALTISCIAICGAGVLIALISIPFFMHYVRIKKNCSAQTMGIVIDYRHSNNHSEPSIAPLTEFWVDGERYTAYRHYKGVVSSKKSTTQNDNADFFISESDWFHKCKKGTYAYYAAIAEKKWPLGTKLPVLYNPKKPKQAYVEKVVVISNIVGTVLVSVGAGMIVLAGIIFLLN